MKGVTISSFADPDGKLLASIVSGHGRNEIHIIPLAEDVKQLQSKIEFEAEEKIRCVRWIAKEPQTVEKPKGRKRKAHGEVSNGDMPTDYCYLAILLKTGEILVYSPLSKEYTTKMSNESPLSCICYGGSTSTIMGFDPANSILKKYNLFDSRPLGSSTIKLENDIDFIETINDRELILASSNLHFYNEEGGVLMFTIPAPKSHQNQVRQLVRSKKNDKVVAVSRQNDSTINMISLEGEGKITATLRCSGSVKSLALTECSGMEILLAVTDKGKVEIFRDPFNQVSKKQIKSNASLDSGSNFGFNCLVVQHGGEYRAVYFDNFQIRVQSIDLGDLTKVEGTILVTFEGDEDTDRKVSKGAVKAASKKVVSDSSKEVATIEPPVPTQPEPVESLEDPLEDKDVELLNTLPEIEDSHELYTQVVSHIEDQTVLGLLLVKNAALSRQTVYLLSDEEAAALFKSTSLLLCSQQKSSGDLGQWLKWLLLCKGSLLAKDSECVGLLKLLRSTLAGNLKLLPSLLSLQGRLSLLESQLKLREEMMHIEAEKEEKQQEKDANESVDGELMDGENDVPNNDIIENGLDEEET
ncbi:DEKNAAC103327 [Brettanomyces naardenensis]|uniref:DEKNAAC103327 n=1 Tax=Brettanomyces naardenensis TaxID=13370 RepID=A0A448YN29_BRENA|nr:DEKNAAC103327 [Brettanomyces naardenensis]